MSVFNYNATNFFILGRCFITEGRLAKKGEKIEKKYVIRYKVNIVQKKINYEKNVLGITI